MRVWHSMSPEQTGAELDSGPEGLGEREAARRLERLGANVLEEPKPPSLLLRLLAQLKDPMILVLLLAAGLSLAASGGRDWLDGAIILVIVGVNALLSVTQEDHARQALEELRQLSAPRARVRREGKVREVPAEELVPGDLILVEAGDLVPADGRLLSAQGLRTDESAMTGESQPVDKAALDRLPEDTPEPERANLLLAGSLVTGGRGEALVTETGMDTRMGRIADLLLDRSRGTTPLQKRMAAVSKTLSLFCAGICGVMFALGLLRGREWLSMFLTAVSLAVAAVPEGLPAAVTIVLALGVRRMADRGAIVKKLPAVETLGCAGVICTDKTGTLTRNRMEVRQLWTLPGGKRREACLAACLCSSARLVREGKALSAQGDPTECALALTAAAEGLDREALERERPRYAELPFDSGRKLMSTVYPRAGGGWTVYVKGAPDVLLDRCTLTPDQRRQVLAANGKMAGEALRVIGAAERDLDILPRNLDPETVESGLTFLGLFGLTDPPRPEVKEAVRRCRQAGIRPVMITGDHPATALAVAEELELLSPGDLSVTGPELDFMPQSMLEEDIDRFSVFARVTPEHKMRIVEAWQKKGAVVAMTGDGVNDAPALRAADIGCAMGRSGTEVAKGAADMILTDDNFSTIVSAVEEGRGIYDNIRKAIHYLLSCNLGEIFTVFTATLLDFSRMPLIPVQLLWLNLVTDSLPALALGVEPVEEDAMSRPPRNGGENFFDREFSLRLLWQGLMIGGLALGAYGLGLERLGQPGLEEAAANTMAFATLTLSQLFHAWNIRSEDRPLLSPGGRKNPAMWKAFLTGLALQLAVLVLPPLQGVFATVPMTGSQWLAVLLLAAAPIPVCEAEKRLRRRGRK